MDSNFRFLDLVEHFLHRSGAWSTQLNHVHHPSTVRSSAPSAQCVADGGLPGKQLLFNDRADDRNLGGRGELDGGK